jgi:geranylgeranyl pyrophosphate synthase
MSQYFQMYLRKTFNKTASLIAYSCKANAILASAPDDLIEAAFEYGKNIGIAFQLIDDLLDFQASSELLGKPAGADLV